MGVRRAPHGGDLRDVAEDREEDRQDVRAHVPQAPFSRRQGEAAYSLLEPVP